MNHEDSAWDQRNKVKINMERKETIHKKAEELHKRNKKLKKYLKSKIKPDPNKIRKEDQVESQKRIRLE